MESPKTNAIRVVYSHVIDCKTLANEWDGSLRETPL